MSSCVVQLGFKTATVTYDRLPRLHGETKYTLAKMVVLSVNGITSLSVRPIRLIALMGIMLFVVFAGMSVWVFGIGLPAIRCKAGRRSCCSFQSFAVAVIGEYVGKIYFETKSCPRYIVDQEIDPSLESGPSRDRADAV